MRLIGIGKSVTLQKYSGKENAHRFSVPYHLNSQSDLDSLKKDFSTFRSTITFSIIRKRMPPFWRCTSIGATEFKARIETVQKIQEYGKLFQSKTHLEIYYSGMPLIRTVMTTQIANETKLFLLLAPSLQEWCCLFCCDQSMLWLFPCW